MITKCATRKRAWNLCTFDLNYLTQRFSNVPPQIQIERSRFQRVSKSKLRIEKSNTNFTANFLMSESLPMKKNYITRTYKIKYGILS